MASSTTIRRIALRLAGLVLLVGGGLAVQVPAAHAAVISVTSPSDTNDPGTIRWAFGQASANAGPDTIAVDPAIDDITLAGSALFHSADEDLVLQGNGVTIHAAPSSVGLVFSASPNALLMITDTTFTGLTQGVSPAVRGDGDVTLERVTVTGNTSTSPTSAGVWAGAGSSGKGHLTLIESTLEHNDTVSSGTQVAGAARAISMAVTNSKVTGNSASGSSQVAGGLYVSGDVSVTRSVISDNSTTGEADTDVAGGVFGNAKAIVLDSTISANSSNGIAGGINASAVALTRSTVSGNGSTGSGGSGGIASTGDVVVVNSTVSGNFATVGSGGGISAASSLALTHATVVDNAVAKGGPFGANVVSAGAITTTRSVIARPQGDVNCVQFSGTPVSSGYNYSDDMSCALTGTGDVQGGGDPLLGPLGNSGGPTETREPQASSPLIDKIPPSGCGVLGQDQRGVDRPQGGSSDIGSVEVASTSPKPCLPPPRPSPPPCATTPQSPPRGRPACTPGGSSAGQAR